MKKQSTKCFCKYLFTYQDSMISSEIGYHLLSTHLQCQSWFTSKVAKEISQNEMSQRGQEVLPSGKSVRRKVAVVLS